MLPLPFTHGRNVSKSMYHEKYFLKNQLSTQCDIKKLIISAEKNILHKKYLYCLKIWQLIEKILLK